ncbi:hypothetical protein J0X19_08165 [Hymenobacter sp. BT186]|uniref:Circularly permuted type 2 ATP-grasp protein n=1 Tax=Hymenobacter telluris TaxID=2816474 RepID=A0A939EUS9_9BACT|nr:hypothetical protein [Hymenobacter telluris]MBO0357915.1 hypothetical protein [Hymenobacter telluris]MBW3373942.1 hypothetical protein [Hymenobacter norwichensis]
MIPEYRARYNQTFTPERYQEMLADVERQLPGQLEFRLAETPIFVPAQLRDKLVQAGDDIIRVIQRPDFKQLTEAAIPPHQRVPNEDAHPTFLTFDFAVCRDAQGELEPQLIEMQGFPSLYAFQTWQPGLYADHFDVAEEVTPYFNVTTDAEYKAEMRELLLGDGPAEETILLELFPEKQKTRVDFALTKQFWGIEAVCITKIRKRGRQLFYEKDGREIQIKRIYNRIIFDELERYPDLQSEYHLTDDVDVTWVGHPNWFFRISKYTLPLIQSAYSPPSYYLHELSTYPADLENYVLKPLFSFAGAGVRLHVTAADLDALPDKQNYLLQRKVTYEPAIQSPDGLVKCEIRLLYVWFPDAAQPRLLTGLGRMSRGEMIGVNFNKDKDWVGGTSPLFERG